MNNIKLILYVSIPFLCALMAGTYEWIIKHFLEPKSGMDNFDTVKWTLIAVASYGFFGFQIGLMIDFFIWLIATLNRKLNIIK